MGGAADERCGADGNQDKTFHCVPQAVVVFGIKDLTGKPGTPLWPVDPRANLYTVTVVDSTRGVYGSCLLRFSHRCLRLSKSITAVFAKRLKEARALRGLSQRALGGLVAEDKDNGGVRINRYEQQTNRADMDTAGELARALDVPLAYLFAESDDLAEVILAFSKLNKAERVKVVADLKALAEAKSKAR